MMEYENEDQEQENENNIELTPEFKKHAQGCTIIEYISLIKNDEKNGIRDDNNIVKATKEFANIFNKYGFSDNIAHKAYDIRKIFKTCDDKFTQLEQTILVDLAPSKAEEAFSLIPSLKSKVSEEEMQQLLDELNKYVVM